MQTASSFPPPLAALAPLVGAEDAGLELLVGALLDVVEGEALLQADVAEPFADLLRVAGHLGSSRGDVMESLTGEPGAAARPLYCPGIAVYCRHGLTPRVRPPSGCATPLFGGGDPPTHCRADDLD